VHGPRPVAAARTTAAGWADSRTAAGSLRRRAGTRTGTSAARRQRQAGAVRGPARTGADRSRGLERTAAGTFRGAVERRFRAVERTFQAGAGTFRGAERSFRAVERTAAEAGPPVADRAEGTEDADSPDQHPTVVGAAVSADQAAGLLARCRRRAAPRRMAAEARRVVPEARRRVPEARRGARLLSSSQAPITSSFVDASPASLASRAAARGVSATFNLAMCAGTRRSGGR
jgi:hypothetical protein